MTFNGFAIYTEEIEIRYNLSVTRYPPFFRHGQIHIKDACMSTVLFALAWPHHIPKRGGLGP